MSNINDKVQIEKIKVAVNSISQIKSFEIVADESERLNIDVSSSDFINKKFYVFQGNNTDGYKRFLLTDKFNSTPANRYTEITDIKQNEITVVADETARFALTSNDVLNGGIVYQDDTDIYYGIKDVSNLSNANGYIQFASTTIIKNFISVADSTARLALTGSEYENYKTIVYQGNDTDGYIPYILIDKTNITQETGWKKVEQPFNSSIKKVADETERLALQNLLNGDIVYQEDTKIHYVIIDKDNLNLNASYKEIYTGNSTIQYTVNNSAYANGDTITQFRNKTKTKIEKIAKYIDTKTNLDGLASTASIGEISLAIDTGKRYILIDNNGTNEWKLTTQDEFDLKQDKIYSFVDTKTNLDGLTLTINDIDKIAFGTDTLKNYKVIDNNGTYEFQEEAGATGSSFEILATLTKTTLEADYLIGFGGNTSTDFIGKQIIVNNSNGLRVNNNNPAELTDNNERRLYKIIAGTDGNTNSQLKFISNLSKINTAVTDNNNVFSEVNTFQNKTTVKNIEYFSFPIANKTSNYTFTTNEINYDIILVNQTTGGITFNLPDYNSSLGYYGKKTIFFDQTPSSAITLTGLKTGDISITEPRAIELIWSYKETDHPSNGWYYIGQSSSSGSSSGYNSDLTGVVITVPINYNLSYTGLISSGLDYKVNQTFQLNNTVISTFILYGIVDGYDKETGGFSFRLFKRPTTFPANGSYNTWKISLLNDLNNYILGSGMLSNVTNRVLTQNSSGDIVNTTEFLDGSTGIDSYATNDQISKTLNIENRLTSSFVVNDRPTVVTSILLSPPTNAKLGESFLINGTGTNEWTGQDNKIAIRINHRTSSILTKWAFYTPSNSDKIIINTGTGAGKIYLFNGTSWSEVISSTGSTPTGAILPFYGTTIPTGYLLCDGTTFDNLTYPALYTFLGNSNTLPDLRGVFLRGKNGTRSTTTGNPDSGADTIGLYQADAFKSHNHNIYTDRNDSDGYHSRGSNKGHIGNGYIPSYLDGYYSSWITNTGGSETRPRNVTVNFIIKT